MHWKLCEFDPDQLLGLELYNNSLFLFCGGRNDRFKGLFWDGEGFIMLYKRFENGHLQRLHVQPTLH
ncbi:IS66 family insertion sequence element accessory protein TnpB [Limosilactobacillus reuteri]|uniref:IS66 family insertion sequence element accessory protein TnpB n=1 Tax=Limosilactobacillus reuteri TaxID=1598 RepID=UPI00143DA2DE|nr:IS66 family insertion sequence element accessory protein TnpB [Limosilactobacillus reuteri]QIZ05333.1 transposase [Limosilactobacillus reuteri]